MQGNPPRGFDTITLPRWLRPLNPLGLGLGLAITTAALGSPGLTLADPPVPSPVARQDYPSLRAYDLGTVPLAQRGGPDLPPSLPIALTGLLGLPPETGPVPLVVLLHGRHRGCHFATPAPSQWPCPAGQETQFDWGLAYLAERLTRAGLAVLVPNLNGAFADTHGAREGTRNWLADQRSQQLIDAHLQRLAIASQTGPNPFDLPLQGRLNWRQLALVGHSMGGGAAALSALNRQGQTSPEAIHQGLGAVAALVLVSPTRSHPLVDHAQAYQLADVPTAVLLGGCDRDILDYSSLAYLENAYRDQARRTPVLGLMLLGANHNFFNAAVAYDDYYRWPSHPTRCDPQRSNQRLSRVVQEQWLQRFLVEFLTIALAPCNGTEGGQPARLDLATDSQCAQLTDQGDGGSPSQPIMPRRQYPPEGASLGLAPDRPAPDRLYDQPVLTNLVWPTEQRYTLVTAGDAAFTYQPSPGLQVETCRAFRPCQGASRSPAFPTVLRLRWQQPGQGLVFPFSPPDLRDFSSLQLRLAGLEALPPGTTSAPLGILLRDRHGGAVRLDLPPSTAALNPLPQDPNHPPVTYPAALRLPLAQFRGVDLANLVSLELRFDGMPQGGLDLVEIEFLKGANGGDHLQLAR